MKYCLLLFLFIGSPEYIGWRKLHYSDFKGPKRGEYAALSTTQITLETTGDNGRYSFKATARFLPYQSFINSPSVLAHEQLHFDITELFARKIDSALAPLQKCSYKQCARAYQIHDSLIIEWDKFQRLYDRETKHSLDTAAQKIWERTINLQ